MKNHHSAFTSRPSIKGALAAALLLCGRGLSAQAEAPKSLLPAFGNEGAEFTKK